MTQAKRKLMSNFHTSVLLKEAIDLLQVKKGEKYIDATLGGAGHALQIIKRGGLVLGIDCDEEALEHVEKSQKSKVKSQKLILAKGNFRNLEEIARSNNFNKVAGIIFDLGVSSFQIENGKRGFSFLKDGPLDMRMDKSLGVKASDLINSLPKGELYEIFTKLGEEHRARAISDGIVSTRRIAPIKTTGDLSSVIQKVLGIKGEITDFTKANISKRVFQALRIAVNDELENLRVALPKSLELLESGGRVEVISFHSLEDRIVKRSFMEFEKTNMGRIIIKKPIVSSKEELEKNPRARSAKLRVFERN
ncbi:MAG: 16S rRNA (cytosine(1402)-N(4))-methyltransferase RsmH [Patescibacteria group bacterium]|nr:16S rRNA (cytosine(1402)-N(4))-methyltransferase RsmH [Patescibacteria group bacterium]